MRRLQIRIPILCLIVVAATVTNVFSNQEPSAVIEASLRAIGSNKEIAAVRNIRAFADCTGPKRNYTTELFSARKSKLIFHQVYSADSSYLGLANAHTFWTKDEKTGDFTLADANAAFAWRSHDYQMLALEIGERFRQLEFEAEEIFDGKTVFKFNAKDELDHPATVFFDKTSKLLLGFEIQNPFNAQETIRTTINEWKQVGKLKLPSKVTATDKQGNFVLSFKEISLNKIDEKLFDVPLSVRAMSELLELHKQYRVDHFNRDATSMVSTFADDFTNIAGGRISKPSREASLERFKNYFARSTFLEWDDITPPVIKVSDDATMGHVVVNKRVRLQIRDESGASREETEIFAWVALYRKLNGKWRLTGMVSTNTPEIDK